MVVPFTKFKTKKWVVLASKIEQLFIGVGISFINHKVPNRNLCWGFLYPHKKAYWQSI